MTSEGESGNETQEEFKPRGTVAVTAAFVVVMLILWFSVYAILLSRGATI